MLVRSSPVECTPLTLPPWYQSHTIATAFPATKSAAGEPRRASLPGATPANGGAASDVRVVSTARVLPRRMKGLLETLPRTRVLSAFSAHPQGPVGQYAPRLAMTAGIVFTRIVMSSQSDQFSR